MKHRWTGIVLLFLLASTINALPPLPADETSVVTAMGLSQIKGAPALIDFEVKDLKGQSVKLSSFKGKVVLLNFWATWCPPCRQEMPSLEKLYQSMRGNQDFVIVTVDLQEEASVVKEFLSKNAYHFPVFLDATGAASGPYSVEAIPTTYVIDRAGRVIGGVQGAHEWDGPATQAGILKLLKQ